MTLLTPEESAEKLSVSRSFIYTLMRKTDFPSIKLGKCRRIPEDSLDEWIKVQEIYK